MADRPREGEPVGLPRCPGHLSEVARREWRRLARALHKMGILTIVDRAALAAYCQAYGRWVEAEEKLAETPLLLKTPSGYVQQSPWLSISNKQMELMGRYMSELGLTPASRTRVAALQPAGTALPVVVRHLIDPTPASGEEWEKKHGRSAHIPGLVDAITSDE